MQEERPEVERAIEIVARGQGYRVQWSREAHAGRKVYLSYSSVAGTRDRIEVDLNFLFRIPLGDLSRRSMWQPPGFARPTITLVPVEELFAGKLRATLDRAMPRDLFDTIRLPRYAGDTWETLRFRRVHVAFASTLPHPLYRYGRNRLDRVTDRQTQEQLVPMLHVNEHQTAAELKEKAWRVIAPLVELDESEREYIDCVHAGEILPELLFPEDEVLAEQLDRHSALKWKIENVKRYRSTER